MDVVVRTHMISSIGTLTEAKTMMRIATSANLVISADAMHQYVVGPVTLKKMMCMLSDELDRGDQAVYLNLMEARVRF